MSRLSVIVFVAMVDRGKAHPRGNLPHKSIFHMSSVLLTHKQARIKSVRYCSCVHQVSLIALETEMENSKVVLPRFHVIFTVI